MINNLPRMWKFIYFNSRELMNMEMIVYINGSSYPFDWKMP